MNTSSAFGDIALTRFQAMQEQHDREQKQLKENDNASIELPEAIKQLITGSDYWIELKIKRYKKLIREGHLGNLLELAKLAPQMATKAHPSHWFASVCSVAKWERTLRFLKRLDEVRRKAAQVTKRIGESMTKFVYKQLWKGKNVERWAIAAEEMRHDKPNQSRAKLFAYLCKQEGQETTAQNLA